MSATTWVYIQSEPNLWTVGFYDPNGKWNPESDWDNKESAQKQVHYLNGGGRFSTTFTRGFTARILWRCGTE